MPQVRPITDLRNTNEISEICQQSQEHVFITKNCYGDLVVMSMETYELQVAIVEVYKKLLEAESEIINGAPLINGEEVFRKWRTKPGKLI